MSDYLEMSPEYAACQGPVEDLEPYYGYEDDPAYEAYLDSLYPETDDCPEHGEQEIVSYDSTGGPDPYAVNVLACKHRIANFGDENVIV